MDVFFSDNDRKAYLGFLEGVRGTHTLTPPLDDSRVEYYVPRTPEGMCPPNSPPMSPELQNSPVELTRPQNSLL